VDGGVPPLPFHWGNHDSDDGSRLVLSCVGSDGSISLKHSICANDGFRQLRRIRDDNSLFKSEFKFTAPASPFRSFEFVGGGGRTISTSSSSLLSSDVAESTSASSSTKSMHLLLRGCLVSGEHVPRWFVLFQLWYDALFVTLGGRNGDGYGCRRPMYVFCSGFAAAVSSIAVSQRWCCA